jgi:hypothetical protein
MRRLASGLRSCSGRGGAILGREDGHALVAPLGPTFRATHADVSFEHDTVVHDQARSGQIASQLRRGAKLDALARCDVTLAGAT